MIGFDATNSLGQGLAAREKIFSFTLAYFTFINDSVPALSFQITSENSQSILGFVSQKILEYFKNFIILTEGEKDSNGNLISKDESPLAKYYLAAIYYYEPYFDFTSVSVPDIYRLGEAYLLEMFSENVSLLLEKSRKFSNFRVPNFPNSTDQDLWKYFTFALVTALYAGQYVNILQQPLCLPSKLYEKYYAPQYSNKKINNTLKDVNTDTFSLHKYYKAIERFIKQDFFLHYNEIIDKDESDFKAWWDINKKNGGGQWSNKLSNFLSVIKPENKKTAYEQFVALEGFIADTFNTYKALANSKNKNLDATIVDAKNSVSETIFVSEYNSEQQLNDAGFIVPTEEAKIDAVSSFGSLNWLLPTYFVSVAPFYIKKTDFGIDISSVTLSYVFERYYLLLLAYRFMALKESPNPPTSISWEDAPNVIKSYIRAENNYVDTEKGSPTGGQNFSYEFFITYYVQNNLLEFSTPKPLTMEEFASKILYPEGILVIEGQEAAFIKKENEEYQKYLNNFKSENDELSVFFEFSFQPNLQKIKEKFPDKKIEEEVVNAYAPNLKNYQELLSSYLLNFSKTETYSFLSKIVGEQNVNSLTVQEFSSLFDLCVSLQHKVSKKYLQDSFIKSNNLLNNEIIIYSQYFDNTNYSFRRWKREDKSSDTRNLILYNTLTNPSLNNKKSLSLQGHASINIGSTLDFNITNIPKFNPSETFKDDELVYKFISIIENTPIGEFLKKNYNFMPYDFSEVGKNLMINSVSSLPENLILNNNALFVNSHSELSKNLINNLITSIQEMKEE